MPGTSLEPLAQAQALCMQRGRLREVAGVLREEAQVVQGEREAGVVPQPAPEGQALLEGCPRARGRPAATPRPPGC